MPLALASRITSTGRMDECLPSWSGQVIAFSRSGKICGNSFGARYENGWQVILDGIPEVPRKSMVSVNPVKIDKQGNILRNRNGMPAYNYEVNFEKNRERAVVTLESKGAADVIPMVIESTSRPGMTSGLPLNINDGQSPYDFDGSMREVILWVGGRIGEYAGLAAFGYEWDKMVVGAGISPHEKLGLVVPEFAKSFVSGESARALKALLSTAAKAPPMVQDAAQNLMKQIEFGED